MRARLLFLPILLVALFGCSDPASVVSIEKTVRIPSTTTSTMVFIRPPISQTTTTAPPSTSTTLNAPVITAKSVGSGSLWDIIAQCESGGNWGLDDVYDGGLQFDPYIWTSYVAAGKPYALEGYPPYAYQASREMQIIVAIRVRDGVRESSDPFLDAQGMGAWPNCP